MRTGKLPALVHAGTPRLHGALLGEYQPPPAANWSGAVSVWPMLRNDVLGDCVPVGALHLIQAWRANAWGSDWQPADADAEALYRAWAGWDGTPLTDRGTVMSAALASWGSAGVMVGATESVPFIAHIDPAETTALKTAIAEFGGSLAGLLLPDSAITPAGDWRDTSAAPNPANGHCVALVGYDGDGLLCVTWGALRRMSWDFWSRYADEAWAAASRPDWLEARGASPSGLDRDRLMADCLRMAA